MQIDKVLTFFIFLFLTPLFLNREWVFFTPIFFLLLFSFYKKSLMFVLLAALYSFFVFWCGDQALYNFNNVWNGWVLNSFIYSWIFVFLGYFLSEEVSIDRFLSIFLISSTAVMFYFLYGILVSGDVRGVGVLRKPIVKGDIVSYIAILSFLSIIYFRIVKNSLMVVFSSVVFVGAFFLSTIIGTRGGWLAFVLVFITVVALYFKYLDVKYWSVFFISLLFFVMALYFDLGSAGQRGEAIFYELNKCLFDGDCHSSIGYRVWLWKEAVLYILDSNMKVPIDNMVLFLKNAGMPEIFPHFHNDFINVVMFGGIWGVFVFLVVFVFPIVFVLRGLYRSNKLSDRKSVVFLLFIFSLATIEAFFDFSLSDTVLGQRYLLSVYFLFLSFFVFKFLKEVRGHKEAVHGML